MIYYQRHEIMNILNEAMISLLKYKAEEQQSVREIEVDSIMQIYEEFVLGLNELDEVKKEEERRMYESLAESEKKLEIVSKDESKHEE